MKKEIYISESIGETRIAVKENGKLAEVHVDKQSQERTVGNIYKGVVENVIPGMQAAFVNIGQENNAFLPFSEISDPELLSNSNKKSKEIDVLLSPGQEIIVQVIKEPFDKKGARITTDLSIAGRFIVLVPNSKYVGVSKKMRDKYERRRLKKIAFEMKKHGLGIIIRTVAEGKTDKQILNYFVQRYGVLVLMEPPRNGLGILVWTVPLVAFGVAIMAVLFSLFLMKRRGRINMQEEGLHDGLTGNDKTLLAAVVEDAYEDENIR